MAVFESVSTWTTHGKSTLGGDFGVSASSFDSAFEKIKAERNELQNVLMVPRKECAEDLTALGFDKGKIIGAAGDAQILNGVGSPVTMISLLPPGTAAYKRQKESDEKAGHPVTGRRVGSLPAPPVIQIESANINCPAEASCFIPRTQG